MRNVKKTKPMLKSVQNKPQKINLKDVLEMVQVAAQMAVVVLEQVKEIQASPVIKADLMVTPIQKF
jgi:hypothetical protein